MKNIQHNMDMAKQLRKAWAAMEVASFFFGPEKARYVGDLIQDMFDSWLDDLPQPWSNFVPMIEEEFN